MNAKSTIASDQYYFSKNKNLSKKKVVQDDLSKP